MYGRKLWFFDCSLVDKTIYSQWVLMALVSIRIGTPMEGEVCLFYLIRM